MLKLGEYLDTEIAIVVQGPLSYIDELINYYLPFKENVIISTNLINDQEDLNRLLNLGFKVVNVDLCLISGRANFNNQVKTTYNGLIVAKEMGFKYALKIRSDIFINDLIKFTNLIKKEFFYFSAFHDYDGGYLCEHMLFGEIDKMIELWNLPISTSNLPPETQLTISFNEKFNGLPIKFLFSILINNNIMAYWIKHNKFLNDYKYDKLFRYE